MHRFYRLSMVLGLVAISSGHATNFSANERNTSTAICEIIQDANEKFFSSRELSLKLLKNCPEVIPLLVEWEYEDWHLYDTSLTREKLSEGFYRCLNEDQLPLAFVILKNSVPIGVISIDDQPEPELSDLADGNPWAGSFHIIPTERNQGLGEAMAKILITIAKRLGYEKIHFYTSNPQAVHWYVKRGGKIIDTRHYRGHMITTMEYGL